MWQPESGNPIESLDPNPGDMQVGDTYRCSLKCPADEFERDYQLRIMDNEDYESKDERVQQTYLALLPATKGPGQELSGRFTVDPVWVGKTIRIGFVDADTNKEPFGLGGTTPHRVV